MELKTTRKVRVWGRGTCVQNITNCFHTLLTWMCWSVSGNAELGHLSALVSLPILFLLLISEN